MPFPSPHAFPHPHIPIDRLLALHVCVSSSSFIMRGWGAQLASLAKTEDSSFLDSLKTAYNAIANVLGDGHFTRIVWKGMFGNGEPKGIMAR